MGWLINHNITNFKRTPGLNTLGFLFAEKQMDSKRKKEVDAEFTRCYTLSPEAFKKLIAEKVERNRMYTLADTKQRERQLTIAD
jgi:hypothetical protein